MGSHDRPRGRNGRAFAAYVARPDISFSLGAAITHPKVPVRQLAAAAEHGLELAKSRPGKIAVHLWASTVGWDGWREPVGARRDTLRQLIDQAGGLRPPTPKVASW